MNGRVKRVTDKGFGFIAVEGQDKDVFFHSSAVVGTTFDQLKGDSSNDAKDGDQVTFETEDSEKGPRAVNVQLA